MKPEHRNWAISAAEAITGVDYKIDDIRYPTSYGQKTTKGIADLIQRKLPKVMKADIFAFCVEFFCCEELPSDWDQSRFADQGFDWLEENACETFQNMTGPEILEEINVMETSVAEFLQKCGLEVEE